MLSMYCRVVAVVRINHYGKSSAGVIIILYTYTEQKQQMQGCHHLDLLLATE